MKHLESAEKAEEGSTATALDQSSVVVAVLREVEGTTEPSMSRIAGKFEQRPVGFRGVTVDRLAADSSLAVVKGNGTAGHVDEEEETADGYRFLEATDLLAEWIKDTMER
jgi:hypothetical protein